MKPNARFLTLTSIILLGCLSRLIPHLPNFTAISAVALFGAAQYNKKFIGFLIPLTALFLSDCILGFYAGMIWVYSTFALVALIGLTLRNNITFLRVVIASLLSSLCFYLVTDLGQWIGSNLYPHTLQGLVECYVAAIPFSRYEVFGTLFYSSVLFGGFYLVQRKFPVLAKSRV